MSIVANLIRRARGMNLEANGPHRDDDPHPMISKNRVTGWTINVPIHATCQPTKVCAATCYAATGGPACPNNLEKQMRVWMKLESDPEGAAERIDRELTKVKAQFLRWNGLGDLTPGAVEAIRFLALRRPDLPIWVVTRKPAVAVNLPDLPNVFVHLSVDSSSASRLRAWLNAPAKPSRWFASYQASPNEKVSLAELQGFSVVFRDKYKGAVEPSPSCPLNGSESIDGGCLACKRCWTNDAVDIRDEALLRAWAAKPDDDLGVLTELFGGSTSPQP